MGVGGMLQKEGRLVELPGLTHVPCLLGVLKNLGQKWPILRLGISVLDRDTQAIGILT